MRSIIQRKSQIIRNPFQCQPKIRHAPTTFSLLSVYAISEKNASPSAKPDKKAAPNGTVSGGVSAAGFVRTLRLSGVCCCLETASAAVGIAIQSFPAGGVSGTAVSQLVSAAPLELFQHP